MGGTLYKKEWVSNNYLAYCAMLNFYKGQEDAVLGFALMGCGKIAKKYAENLSTGKIPRGRLVAVCDIDVQRAANYGEKYNVPFYADVHHMMEAEDANIDLVAVLTPSGQHPKHTIELVQYGKHIVVEKPMALTLADASAMIDTCDKAGIKLFVVKQNRCNTPVKKLRKAVEEGLFGKMVMGTVRVRWCRKQAYYDEASWRGKWEYDGGAFANQAIHHIDLLQWMMGPVESIFAKSATRLVDIETEDTGVAVLKFTSGALGIIEATTATRPVDLEGSLSILGEKGTVEIGGFFANEMKVWNFADETAEQRREVMKLHQCNPKDVYAFSHVEYLKDIVENIIYDKKNSLVDGVSGRKSLELISAIYESIETKQEVPVNFSLKKCRLGLPQQLGL